MTPPTRTRAALTLISVALLAACSPAASGASAGASAGATGGGTAVAITLQEFSVLPDPDSVPAGSVTFTVTNDGPEDVHEFVIVRTDLDPGDLPVDDTGTVDESGDGIEVIDEIEDIPVGETVDITVDLAAGAYVLVCNIYDADEDEAHYAMGMRAAFTVEGG